mmetsp:Transcript_21482/g.54060  ORF Transcript_21482/g.54060 Transcript_21482/m.54060 type:complete len:240 (-) Transcript_21482:551-1270(-)
MCVLLNTKAASTTPIVVGVLCSTTSVPTSWSPPSGAPAALLLDETTGIHIWHAGFLCINSPRTESRLPTVALAKNRFTAPRYVSAGSCKAFSNAAISFNSRTAASFVVSRVREISSITLRPPPYADSAAATSLNKYRKKVSGQLPSRFSTRRLANVFITLAIRFSNSNCSLVKDCGVLLPVVGSDTYLELVELLLLAVRWRDLGAVLDVDVVVDAVATNSGICSFLRSSKFRWICCRML